MTPPPNLPHWTETGSAGEREERWRHAWWPVQMHIKEKLYNSITSVEVLQSMSLPSRLNKISKEWLWKTHLRADIELRGQVNQHPGNILNHLHHQVLAGQKTICHVTRVSFWLLDFLHVKPVFWFYAMRQCGWRGFCTSVFTVPMKQMVSLEDECQWGTEFRVYSYGAPQLWLSKSSPGLHLHQQSQTQLTQKSSIVGILSVCDSHL